VRWWIAVVLAGCWTGQDPPVPRPAPALAAVIAAAPHPICPVPDGDLDHGQKLVRKKHCLFCHRPRTAESMVRDCNPMGIRLAILSHTDTSNLSATDLDDLVAYVAASW
jgi:hypothetical protein